MTISALKGGVIVETGCFKGTLQAFWDEVFQKPVGDKARVEYEGIYGRVSDWVQTHSPSRVGNGGEP